ncbi:unnamed protein product [Pseudo-nitzschia multistriata]|uniref:Uncharacterized protein n=1 Tax=Pseudo-nitzschia multistriata TaxID=183589 RepID=A0A448ZA78_9STRA|nr:unnamed protein product [Pseudo-nitzschia multistriata]
MYELTATKGAIDDAQFKSSGSLFIATMLDNFLGCPCSSSLQQCTDLADLGNQAAEHSLSLREETATK